VQSTAAIVFLGTPHRGSGAAALGDVARRVASILLVSTNAALLDSLGLKNSDLERCQHYFSTLWDTHRFEVKTFQESKPWTGYNVAGLNEKASN
jgi:hypothetical protein